MWTFVCTILLGSSLSIVSADRACVVDGESFDSGSTFTLSGYSKCFVFICRDGSYTLQSGGCEDKQGNCQDVGSTWVDKCTTYSCTVVDNTYSTNIDSIQCKDADDVCRSPGETFPLVINGNRYSSCSCTVSGTQTSYSCSG